MINILIDASGALLMIKIVSYSFKLMTIMNVVHAERKYYMYITNTYSKVSFSYSVTLLRFVVSVTNNSPYFKKTYLCWK